MGQKTHPIGFRLGVNKKWKSNWYDDELAPEYLAEDKQIRDLIRERYRGAGVAEVNIERPTEKRISLIILTARPGIIIGTGGKEIDRFQRELEDKVDRKVRISIKEVENPDLEAILVAEEVAFRIENRFPPARAMREVVGRAMRNGAEGVKVKCSGRLGGSDIARSVDRMAGRVPLQTLRADIDYGFTEARTKYGPIGVKAWVFRGEILPEELAEGVVP